MRQHKNNKTGYNLEDLYEIGSQYSSADQGNIKSNLGSSVHNIEYGRSNEMDRSKSQMSMGSISIFSPLAIQKNTKLKQGSTIIEPESKKPSVRSRSVMDVGREDGDSTSTYLPPVHNYKNVDRNKVDK